MRNLHIKLSQKYHFYNHWHQTKHHNKIHWGVFLVYTFLIFSLIVNPFRFSKESSTTLAQVKIIPLTLDTADASVSQYPVSSGIPFPRGELFSTDNLRLLDAQNQEIPMQAHSLVNWPDGSIKSVLVQFEADVSQTETKTFNLEYGADVKRTANPPTTVKVVQDSQAITIDTGKIKLEFSKTSFTLFNQVWIDQNNNQVYEDNEKTLSNPGDIFLVNAFDNKEYKASLYQSPIYTIEETGPIRAVIKAEGKLQNQEGGQLTDFKVWIYAYAGSEQVKMDYTLVDTREEKNAGAQREQFALSVASYGLKISFNLQSPNYSFGGEKDQIYSSAATGEHYLYQSGRMNYIDGVLYPFTFSYEGVGAGKKAPGWVDVSDKNIGISAAIKDFWQQFPKELAIKDDSLVLYLHPEKASSSTPDLKYPNIDTPENLIEKRYSKPNTFYNNVEGVAKTYQLLFDFHRGGSDSAKINNLNKIFQTHYPLLTASPSWYAESKAFGNIIEAGPWSKEYDETLITGSYIRSVENFKETESKENVDAGGITVMYGWRDYGDRMRPGWGGVSPGGVRGPAFYNDTHVGATGFFRQYLRTQFKGWWELGEIASRHWMDIDVSHSNRLGYWPKGFGPGEGQMIKHEMFDHLSRNIHSGHAHISGLPDYYLLTGDKRALEVMREAGDWWTNVSELFLPTPNPHFAEAERDTAWPLFVLNEAYRATGDTKYLKAASRLVTNLTEWWQQPSDHLVANEVVGRNDWTKGTGWWYMNPRCDNCPYGYNGTNPWMAGAQISALIQFYEYNKDYNYNDSALIKEMLLQTMNYVVKYGWNDTKQYKPYDYFVYSEANMGTDGGSNSLFFPLAYLYKLYYLENKNDKLAHPEWYDTVDKWLSIAWIQYEDYKKIYHRGTTSSGYYGYEFMTFPEFFKEMYDLETNPIYDDIKPPDIIPPGLISDLAAANIKSTSLTLNWTATGDDATQGTATQYDIRYSTLPIDFGNFNQAVQLSNPPAPKVANSKESFVIDNLTPLTTYYFAIKAIDEDGNIGGLSNVSSATTPELDLTSPKAVSDLAINTFTFKSVTLNWTATGDDGNTGIATKYDLRYLNSEITNENFGQATQIKTAIPSTPGTKENAGVFGLNPSSTYYFAIKVIDNAGNTSDLSNIAVKTIPPAPKGLITEVFQEDKDGYQGTQDTYIFENGSSGKFGSGQGISAGRYTNSGYDYLALLKFDLSTIPSNVDIKEAYINLYLTGNSRNGQQKLIWSYLKQPWQEKEVNWYQYDIGKNWEGSGIMGKGDKHDVLEDANGLLIGDINPIGIWKRFNLSTSTVKAWLNKVLPNEGIVIEGGPDGPQFTNFSFASKEAADPNLRPKLVITYEYVDQPPDTAPPAAYKQSDLNQDGKTDQLDFDILKQEWARMDKLSSDLNQDGIVDSRDLGIMMSSWEN